MQLISAGKVPNDFDRNDNRRNGNPLVEPAWRGAGLTAQQTAPALQRGAVIDGTAAQVGTRGKSAYASKMPKLGGEKFVCFALPILGIRTHLHCLDLIEKMGPSPSETSTQVVLCTLPLVTGRQAVKLWRTPNCHGLRDPRQEVFGVKSGGSRAHPEASPPIAKAPPVRHPRAGGERSAAGATRGSMP